MRSALVSERNTRIRGPRSFRFFNYALITIMAGVLTAIVLQRAQQIPVQAEPLLLSLNEKAIANAVLLESSQILQQEGAAALSTRIGANPIRWLQDSSAEVIEQFNGLKYAGDIASAEIETINPGNWFYLKDTGVLGYRAYSGGDRHWRVEPVFEDLNSDSSFDPTIESISGLYLHRIINK